MEGLHLQMVIHPYCEQYGLSTVALKVRDLLNYTVIDPLVQRKLSTMQRRKISTYLQERELEQIFFGPVTLSLRDVSQLTRTEQGFILRYGSKLSVLDGQHRILAIGYVNERLLKEVRSYERKMASLKVKLRKEPDDLELLRELEEMEGIVQQLEARRLALMEAELAVQVYIGLSEEKEKQLFGDINAKVQLVSKELGHAFDSTDPLNLVIQQVVEHNIYLKAAGIEKRNNLTAFNKNFTCFSWLYSTASLLFSGKMQPSYELGRKIRQDPSYYVEVLHQFCNTVLPLMPDQPGLSQYTSSNRVMQESIALFAYEVHGADGYQQNWSSSLKVLEGFDWSHDNELLVARFGKMDNGKLNLIHEKSLRKHDKLVDLFKQLGRLDNNPMASLA